MTVTRRGLLAGLAAMVLVGAGDEVAAKGRRGGGGGGRRRRVRGSGGGYSARGVSDDGSCPCNGGDVCVGPRGGRYCITSSGRKRYGV
jgi:hypothetical protein